MPLAGEVSLPERLALLAEKRRNGTLAPHEETYLNYDVLPDGQFFLLLNNNGDLVAHNIQDPTLLSVLKQQNPRAMSQILTVGGSRSVWVHVWKPGRQGELILVGMDWTKNAALLTEMRWLLTALVLVCLLAAGMLGYWFAGRAMDDVTSQLPKRMLSQG